VTPLRRVVPEPLEGPNAFAIRLAAANRVSTHELHEMNLLLPWPSMQELLTRVGLVRRQSAAYCPTCMERSGVGRLGWELSFADACVGCGRWLVDICHGCGELVSWNRASMMRCDCGCSLLDQAAPFAPDALVDLSRTIESSVTREGSVQPGGVEALTPTQLRDLVRLLGRFGGGLQQDWTRKRANSASLAASWPVSTLAAEVLSPWPLGFKEYLAGVVARFSATEVPGSLHRVFGAFYRGLYLGLRDSAFDFVRDSFQSYVVQEWPGALNGRNKRIDPESMAEAKWEPLSHAKARLAASEATMRNLVADGTLRAVHSTTPSGRTVVVVHRDDVDASAGGLARDLTLHDVALELGLKRSRLAALLPYVCPEARQAIDGRSPWAIPSAWLGSWQKRLADLPPAALSDSTRTFAWLLRYGAWSTARLAKLICDMATGAMPVVGRLMDVHGWPAMVFDRRALLSWCAADLSGVGVTGVPEAAKTMCVKQEVAYLLVRRGLLGSTIRRDHARKWSSVSDTQIERFNVDYVWCRELAVRLGRSPRAVSSLLVKQGVVQASGPSVDGSRQILYRRREAEASIVAFTDGWGRGDSK
jgi:hypothetical protein